MHNAVNLLGAISNGQSPILGAGQHHFMTKRVRKNSYVRATKSEPSLSHAARPSPACSSWTASALRLRRIAICKRQHDCHGPQHICMHSRGC